jgi:enterochelin esterase-like enzyme
MTIRFRNALGRVVCASSLLLIAASAAGQSVGSTILSQGMVLERSLVSPEEHVYTADLDSGAAIIGEIDQDGVDLVIDVFGPDRQQIAHIDSSNGEKGSEPIDVTASHGGTYRFVVHAADKKARPGRYAVKIEQVVSPAANARRLARQAYPVKALFDLWEESVTDPAAADRFVAARKGKTPVIDATPVNASETRITYVCPGDRDTERVVLYGGPDFGVVMRRLGRTNLFLGTQLVANDARFEYSFTLREVHRSGPNGEVEIAEAIQSGPWLLEMPDAPKQPDIVAKEGVPKGNTVEATIKSTILSEERTLTVYTPAGYDGKVPCNLLIIFDGITYGGRPAGEDSVIPAPVILDNLIATKRIGPTVAVLIWTMGKRNRDLTGSKPFADFIAGEVVPWARAHYAILPGAGSVVVAGSSLGGFSASWCAFNHPEAIGNVLSQSGAYWVTSDWQNVRPPYPRETGMLIEMFKREKQLPIRFYISIGRYDLGAAMLGSNRELRDVLQMKGYDVDYRELDGGHDYEQWRGTLSDGLISLLGKKGGSL